VRSGELHIGPSRTTHDGRLLEVEFASDSAAHRVFIRSDGPPLADTAEAFVACALLPCMKAGRVLVADREVSGRLLAALPTLLDIYSTFFPSLHRVDIKNATPAPRDHPTGQRVGVFFSCGVDSFYTLLKHREEITDLVFVHGFDIRLDDTALCQRASEAVHAVAAYFGKRVIQVETNIRGFLDAHVPWAQAHGAALASIGHLFSPPLRRVYIPASHTYADLFPWGSHPMLDPLWSSERLEYLHDGCEATRVAKIERVAECQVALDTLRVCNESTGAYNCGHCEKCLRTMINLSVVGALDRCRTFAEPLDVRRMRELEIDGYTRPYMLESLHALEARGGDATLRDALRHVLDRPEWLVKTKRHLSNWTLRFPLAYRIGKWLHGVLVNRPRASRERGNRP